MVSLLWRVFARLVREGRLRVVARGLGFCLCEGRARRAAFLLACPRVPPSLRCCFCGRVFSFCFLSGGYALSPGVTPCFLIAYAPAMRGVAYYALSGVAVVSTSRGLGRGVISRVSAIGARGRWRVALGFGLCCAWSRARAASCARVACSSVRRRAWCRVVGHGLADTLCAAWFLAGGIEWVGDTAPRGERRC